LDSTNGRALLLRYLSLAGPQRTAPSQRGVGLARSTTHPLVLGCARARDPLRPSVGWRRSGEAAPSRGCGCPSLAEPGDDSARQQPLVVRPPGWGSTSRPHVGPLAARWVTVGGPAPMEPPTEFERRAPRAGPRGRARGRSATPSSGPPGESGLHMWVSGPKPHLRGGATSGQSMHCTHPAARHGPPFRGPGGAAHASFLTPSLLSPPGLGRPVRGVLAAVQRGTHRRDHGLVGAPRREPPLSHPHPPLEGGWVLGGVNQRVRTHTPGRPSEDATCRRTGPGCPHRPCAILGSAECIASDTRVSPHATT
jgi:hypothetical protein